MAAKSFFKTLFKITATNLDIWYGYSNYWPKIRVKRSKSKKNVKRARFEAVECVVLWLTSDIFFIFKEL